MPRKIQLALAGLALALGVAAGPALAQYDREGRYVPSPMGVPADPNAQPIPLYSGRPGEAKGTPMPRREPEQRIAPMAPRLSETPPAAPLPRALPLVKCEDGWSRATGLTPAQFRRFCRKRR